MKMEYEMDEDEEKCFEALDMLTSTAWCNAEAKGFHGEKRSVAEQIALLHSELSEMLEYDRHGNPASDHIAPLTGIEEEAADVVIRLMDMTQSLGLNLPAAIMCKMKFNASREFKHGKAY